MAAAAAALAGGSPARGRFRGCLAGALLGDCLGAAFEGRDVVVLPELLRYLRGLEPPGRAGGGAQEAESRETLCYTDDTAMARCVVRSLLAKGEFDEVDMARRFAEEHKKEPDRGYGMAVVKVFKKLLSPKCSDVFEPARVQFNGKGSYGNGGAMRVAGISLIYPDVQDVKKFAKLSAELTHANSLGYNGAILQALAVHLALQGELSWESFLEQLIGHMEDVEADDKSLADARAQWHCCSGVCPHCDLFLLALHEIRPRYSSSLQQPTEGHHLLYLAGWRHRYHSYHGWSHCRSLLWGGAGTPVLGAELRSFSRDRDAGK
ncbi:ADP-ribose glycohydrolase ARH3 isoform X3 [Dermochelys coriacea]|uniref:ADP-ribose glycohydrolase ARH3 isoform X3 n=1 Tax=Dermochelys coriacea TaxID=27794 RepID=UPI0018E7DF7A|nr:ADP-ribose glycohydrolase ARH3 isoform X3 [Dermochelys coriacea]